MQVQQLQQLGNGGDLVGFRVSFDLSQGQALLGSPGADHVNGSFLPRPVIGASRGLAVNGHHLAGEQFRNGLGPGHEGILQLHWVEAGKDSAEGVVGWNAVGQFQKGLKPGQLAFAEQFDMDPGIGSADGGADGDRQDVHQFVASGTFYSRIVQLSEMIQNSCLGRLRHARLPPRLLPDHGTLAHL